jgi:hypothetical protein
MKKLVHVALDWKWIFFNASDTWKKDLVPKLTHAGIDSKDVKRAVYVIRLAENFGVQYPRGVSSTIYVGRGSLSQRLGSHKDWLNDILELAPDGDFEVAVAFPKVKNSDEAFKDVEAYLIEQFSEIFGSAPLANSIFPNRTKNHYVYSSSEANRVLKIGSGKKLLWAITPMKSNNLFSVFNRTHSV